MNCFSGGRVHVDDRTRIECLIFDPAIPVHIAARIAHDSATADSIIERPMRVTVDPEHGHVKEGIRKLGDEGT